MPLCAFRRPVRLAGLAWALFAAVVLLVTPASAQPGYEQSRQAAVKACEAIDPSESQTGLLFNPDGFRSFYVRSQCFQEAAVRYRDATLCAQVRERRSWFSSSWGYSAPRCRMLVEDAAAGDRVAFETLEREYRDGGITLRDFRIVLNGNGRDYDILPAFNGRYAHGYTLRFELLEGPAQPILLHASGYYLDANSNLSLYVRVADIRSRFPAFAANRTYTVRATVSLNVATMSQSSHVSDGFLEQIFPERERSQSITREVTF